ncbi:MAG: hypothetical protein HYY16_19580 [Planctomycetes bacterium]|nr:hypothetical protein [Planctomycetota bacterium]
MSACSSCVVRLRCVWYCFQTFLSTLPTPLRTPGFDPSTNSLRRSMHRL